MTTKHTPGPWEIDGEYVQQVGQTGLAICDVMNMDVGGDKGWHSGPVTQANKNLIAAAPELLETLQLMLDAFVDDPLSYQYSSGRAVDAARAAIAKARGSQ
jgi:hypothetical protein